MSEILLASIPIIMIFFIGILLKGIKVFRRQHADDFIKVVFYVSLPGLIMNSIMKVELKEEFLYLPLISASVIFCMYFISSLIGRFFKLPKTTFGTFLIGTMILNNGFMLPFIISNYGDEGLSRLIIFDFSNGLLAFTFVYYHAIKYGRETNGKSLPVKKFLYSPPIWALLAAVILNLSGQRLPQYLTEFFRLLGDLTIPLLMLSIGIYFSPKAIRLFPVFAAIFIRSGIGFLLGFIFTEIFDINGLSRIIVLLGSSAPIGFNTLTFASLEKLDKEFAATMVSFAIITGLILTPLLIYFLGG